MKKSVSDAIGVTVTLIVLSSGFQIHCAQINLSSQTNSFAGCAGSANCRTCHEEAYSDWEKSNHALAERAVYFGVDRAAFETSKPLDDLPDTSVGIRDGKLFVATVGLSGKRETNFVERVIGNDPLQQFLVAAPGGRWRPLEASWDVHKHEWFNSNGHERRQPGEWGHWTGRGMNWNSMCAECHNTKLRKNYDDRTDSYRTTMAETGVGCEACHGPLQAHNEWQQSYGKSGKPDPTLRRFSPQETLDNCGRCHSRRAELTGKFNPGDNFFDHYDLDIVDGSNLFFADGQVHEEDFEFAAFLGSRMYAAGVSCNDCHQPHTGKTKLPGNFLCLRCHSGGYSNAPVIDPVAHSHHKVRGYDVNGKLIENNLAKFSSKNFPETGGECVNCHMPQTTYMQRHKRRDHSFTVPDPLLTKEFQIPNACNRCHSDKSVDWALEATEKWYGEKMNRPTRRRAELFADARTGDVAAVEPLLQLVRSNEIPYWKAAAINLLEPWTDNNEVQAALLRSLTDTNALVRTKAAQVFGESTQSFSEQTFAGLHSRLNDSVRSIRVAAAWALRGGLQSNSVAWTDLNSFLNQSADQPGGQSQLGECFAARGEFEKALEHFRKAVAWETNSAPMRRNLAIVYKLLNQNREAEVELREAEHLDSRNDRRAAPR